MNYDDAIRAIRKRLPELPLGPPPPLKLFHYTSQAGITGIISSQKIWATHPEFLNDSSELHHAPELVEAAVEEAIKRTAHEDSREFLNRMKRNITSMFVFFPPFVACFCEEPDLLSQWRAYAGNGGGYSIGFPSWEIARLTTPCAAGESMLLRVEYDLCKQETRIQERIAAVCTALEQSIQEYPNETSILIPAACGVLRGQLVQMILSFKHPAFSEEKEWRLVSIAKDARNPCVRFRDSAAFAVPYVELAPFSVGPASLRIETVRMGPRAHPKLAKQSLEWMLANYGCSNVVVEQSTTPLRG